MITRIVRDEASAEFYDGTANNELLLRHCVGCDRLSAPQLTQCPFCGGTVLRWSPAAGTATLISWSVPRDRQGTAIAIAGLIELAEGPWLRARIVNASIDELAAGLPLTVCFERSGDDGSAASETVDGAGVVPGRDEAGEIVPVAEPARG